MMTRRQVPASHRAWLNLNLILILSSIALGRGSLVAQQVTALIQFTNVWEYDQSGSNLGTAAIHGMQVVAAGETPLVVDDLTGPKVLSAIADDGFGPRSIHLRFSEALNITSLRIPGNFQVSRLGNSNPVTVTNVLYNVMVGALLRLDAADTNWVQYDDYVITINGVTDSRGNAIAPNTRIPVGWSYPTNLIDGSQPWDFHDSAIFDPEVYDEPWYAEDYVPGPWWGRGSGGFYGGLTLQYPCPSIAAPRAAISYQTEPTLFRTSFQWPGHWPATGNLSLRFAADDGLVLYVNGIESYRYNAVGDVGSGVSINSRSLTSAPNYICVTNVVLNVTNLHPGTNWIAVAVIQSSVDQQDSYFVFDMSGSVLFAPALPGESSPILEWSKAGLEEVVLSWTGSGYALETSETLELGPLSYPTGPWTEVRAMSNPYSWRFTNGVQRYFRLKK